MWPLSMDGFSNQLLAINRYAVMGARAGKDGGPKMDFDWDEGGKVLSDPYVGLVGRAAAMLTAELAAAKMEAKWAFNQAAEEIVRSTVECLSVRLGFGGQDELGLLIREEFGLCEKFVSLRSLVEDMEAEAAEDDGTTPEYLAAVREALINLAT